MHDFYLSQYFFTVVLPLLHFTLWNIKPHRKCVMTWVVNKHVPSGYVVYAFFSYRHLFSEMEIIFSEGTTSALMEHFKIQMILEKCIVM